MDGANYLHYPGIRTETETETAVVAARGIRKNDAVEVAPAAGAAVVAGNLKIGNKSVLKISVVLFYFRGYVYQTIIWQ